MRMATTSAIGIYRHAPFAVGVTPNLGLVTNSMLENKAEIVANARALTDNYPPSPGVRAVGTYLASTRVGNGKERDGPTKLYSGDIAELLEFKRDLSDAERRRVQSYLALKYGLTLDRTGLGNAYTSGSGTSVYSDSGYWHSIIGLGRDELTTLDQRVSRSTQKIGTGDLWVQQGDSPLTIATSADFTSANPGGRQELGAGQYLVLGDNDGALNALSASAMGRNNNRLPRVWRAQTTGVGSVFLGLDATTLRGFDSSYPRYLFVESGAGADGSFPADRTHAYALSNTLTDLTGYWVPVAVGAPLAVNIPSDGAYLSYGVRSVPILALTVQSRGDVGTFRFSGNRGFVASSVTTTAEMQPRSTPGQWLSDGGDHLVINVTMPTATGWSLEAASCIDRRAAASDNPSGNPSGAVLGRVSESNQFTIPASQLPPAADLHCALVARYDSGSTLKTVSGRVFIDNGAGGGVANDGHINGAETGRSGAALSLTNCGSGSTTIYAYTSSSGDGRYSLKVPPTVTD